MKRMTNGMNARRLGRENRRASTAFTEGIYTSHLIGAARERLFWYKRPAAPKLIATASRVDKPLAGLGALALQAGSYGWAKAAAFEAAQNRVKAAVNATPGEVAAMADLVLHRPNHSGNHGTAHFAGKPYHWRQDYTGQLKLAAGESPW